MEKINEMRIDFTAKSENEAFARIAMGAFLLPLNPTMEEMEDIRTAVSEAVTNCIVHGYENGPGVIVIRCEIEEETVTVVIEDYGVGIDDVDRAMQPLYTSKPELERSGMGFSFMEAFMDSIKVESEPGEGTRVIMTKQLGSRSV